MIAVPILTFSKPITTCCKLNFQGECLLLNDLNDTHTHTHTHIYNKSPQTLLVSPLCDQAIP